MYRQLLLVALVVCLALELPATVSGLPPQRTGSGRQQSSPPPETSSQSPRQQSGSQSGQQTGSQTGRQTGSQSGRSSNQNPLPASSRNNGLSKSKSTGNSSGTNIGGNRGAAVPGNLANSNAPTDAPRSNERNDNSNSNSNPNLRAIEGAPSEQLIREKPRTALEVLGEEGFQEMGLPEEARHVDMPTALHLATQKMIRDKYGIPKDSTRNMAPEEMLEIVGQLQLFNAEEHVNSEKFWGDVSTGGLDVALGPVVSDKLGLPTGVRAGSTASKVLEDAGQLQTFDLDLADGGNWALLNEFQNGKLTPDQFADRVNQIKSGRNGSGRGTVGGAHSGNGRGGAQSPNSRPGTDGPDVGGLGNNTLLGGQNSSGKSTSPTGPAAKPNSPPAAGSTTTPPGSRGGNTGRGGSTSGSDSTGSTPPGSQNSSTSAPGGSNSGSSSGTGSSSSRGSTTPGGTGGGPGGGKATDAADDGMTAEAQLGSGSYVIVTHNDDGGYTAEVVVVDSNGNQEIVQTETFTDADGDGSYSGDKGGESAEKPKEGLYEGEESEDGTTFTYETESGDSSSDETDSSGDADVDTSDVDEYTPGRDGEYIMPLAQRLTYMQSLMQALNDTKWTPGKGGTDSTPNPMNESFGSGTRPYNPKDTAKRPIDGSSMNSGAIVPLDALQQIQDPNKVQGDVIDPTRID